MRKKVISVGVSRESRVCPEAWGGGDRQAGNENLGEEGNTEIRTVWSRGKSLTHISICKEKLKGGQAFG